jgi:hypothetical protein
MVKKISFFDKFYFELSYLIAFLCCTWQPWVKKERKNARDLKLIPAFDVTTSEAADVFVARDAHYFCSSLFSASL